MTSYGMHIMGDLNGCRLDVMRDGEFLYRFLKDLVGEIGMVPIGSPHLDLYTGPHKEWEGFSGTVHIQTSHITCHVFAFGYVFIDIFSCREFNTLKAIDFIQRAFCPTSAGWHSMDRGFNFPAQYLDEPHTEKINV